MIACNSPTTRTANPSSVSSSPGRTTVTRSATAGSASLIRSATASIVQTGASVARRCSTSQWSGCSWVISTAATPSRASRSDQPPGSMTRSRPPAESRTQEWPNLVILMPASCQPVSRRARRRSTSARSPRARRSATTGWPVAAWCAEACRRGEESQQPTCPQARQVRRCTQLVPSRTQSSQRRSVTSGGRARRARCSHSSRARTDLLAVRRPCRAPSVGPPGSRSSTPRCRGWPARPRRPRAATRPCERSSRTRPRSASQHAQPEPGVALARGLAVRAASGPSRSQAAKSRCSSRDRSTAPTAGRSPPLGLLELGEPRRARPGVACCRSSARTSASSRGSGEGTRSRRASHGQRQPVQQQRAGGDDERDEQQHLAVLGVARGSRRPPPA